MYRCLVMSLKMTVTSQKSFALLLMLATFHLSLAVVEGELQKCIAFLCSYIPANN